MRNTFTDWRELAVAAAIVVAAAVGVVVWLRRPPRDEEEIERKRRSHLNKIGRIVEGQVLEIADAPAQIRPPVRGTAHAEIGGNGRRIMIFYAYTINGVSYETAQDITGMEEQACLDRLVEGQPASVKYDPSNPSNSILVSDDWSGLN